MAHRGLEKRYKCPKCGKLYGQEWTLENHKKNCNFVKQEKK